MWDSRENGHQRLTSTLLLWFRVGLQNPGHPKNVKTRVSFAVSIISFCTAKYPWHPHHRDFSNPQILLVHTRSWVQPQKGTEHERLKSTLSQLAVSTARSQLQSTGGSVSTQPSPLTLPSLSCSSYTPTAWKEKCWLLPDLAVLRIKEAKLYTVSILRGFLWCCLEPLLGLFTTCSPHFSLTPPHEAHLAFLYSNWWIYGNISILNSVRK